VRGTEEGAPKSEISIRHATDADLAAIGEILNGEIATSAYVYAEAPVTIDERREWLYSHMTAGLPVFVATESADDDRVLGWGTLSVYRPSSGYRFTAEASVYVAPLAQRRGIGARLLSALCNEARACRMHALVASIDSENLPSIALFERFEFREVARLDEVGRKLEAWRTQLLFLRPV